MHILYICTRTESFFYNTDQVQQSAHILCPIWLKQSPFHWSRLTINDLFERCIVNNFVRMHLVSIAFIAFSCCGNLIHCIVSIVAFILRKDRSEQTLEPTSSDKENAAWSGSGVGGVCAFRHVMMTRCKCNCNRNCVWIMLQVFRMPTKIKRSVESTNGLFTIERRLDKVKGCHNRNADKMRPKIKL